jgi:hypothetical protein
MIDLLTVKIIVTVVIAWGLYIIWKSDPGETSHWNDRNEN